MLAPSVDRIDPITPIEGVGDRFDHPD